jgi:hypothetical protein
VIDYNVVKYPGPDVGAPTRPLHQIVLQVRILGADDPTPIERIIRRVILLENIGGDPNAGTIASRHSEGEIRTLEVEPILRFEYAAVAAILEVREQYSRKIEGG